jgi:hypothetical protein
LLTQSANTNASEHRDALVQKLMVATGLKADMPVSPFLRRDLSLFFETFESFKVGRASGSASGGAPPPAQADTAQADTAHTALISALAAQPAAKPSARADEVIKVSASTNKQLGHDALRILLWIISETEFQLVLRA